MYVVGVDPSMSMTGVVVMTGRDAGHLEIVGANCFQARDDANTAAAIRDLSLRAFYYGYGLVWGELPIIGIEENIGAGHGNLTSAFAQRELIGAIKILAASHFWEVKMVYPVSAKKAMTGSGKADKADVVRHAKSMFGVPTWDYAPQEKGQRRAPGDAWLAKKCEAIADAAAVALAAAGGKK